MDTDDYLPVSGIQHLLFCERQCALIHVERVWAENYLTVEGRHLHENVDSFGTLSRGGTRVVHRMPLRSDRLKLTGFADVVEFAGATGPETPFPVEFKRGRRKYGACDEAQLCAQALCLEEMLRVPVPLGAIYYGRSRRRLDVEFSTQLRGVTEAAAARFHVLVRTGHTPPPVRGPKCRSCSLITACMPELDHAPDAATYLRRLAADEGAHA